jgi:hypothetical protein
VAQSLVTRVAERPDGWGTRRFDASRRQTRLGDEAVEGCASLVGREVLGRRLGPVTRSPQHGATCRPVARVPRVCRSEDLVMAAGGIAPQRMQRRPPFGPLTRRCPETLWRKRCSCGAGVRANRPPYGHLGNTCRRS